MSQESNERRTEGPNPTLPSHAHELCRKAKETLDKANKLLAESRRQQHPSQHNDEGERP